MTDNPDKPSFDPSVLMSGRADRLKAKLDVLMVFLHERLRLREVALRDLDRDERHIRSLLTAFEERREAGRIDASGLESSLIAQELGLSRERRSLETACWQDTVRLMQGILQVWESAQEAKAREQVLKSGLPQYRLEPRQDYSARRQQSSSHSHPTR